MRLDSVDREDPSQIRPQRRPVRRLKVPAVVLQRRREVETTRIATGVSKCFWSSASPFAFGN